MKLAKLSLAAMVVAGLASSSFAADTLADAFKNGKVKGQLKAWYYDKTVENAADENANVLALGLELNYVTDSLYGFYAGATFQGASQPWIEDDAKTRFDKEMHTSGAVLSEAYLGYKIGKTNAKIGRQYISTPLVNGSGGRIFKESFEGVTVVNTDIPQTTLIAGYVNKFQGRTSAVDDKNDLGDAPDFHKSVVIGAGSSQYASFDGAYTAAVINKSITGLTLTGQYAVLNDVKDAGDVDVYYTEANYVLPVAGFKLGFDVNYRGSRTDSSTLDALDLEGDMVAGRISIKELAGFGASFAASTTDSNDNVILGVGNGPSSYTGTLIRASTQTATFNTDAYLFTATYDFSKLGATGLGILAQYSQIERDKGGSRPADTELTSYAAAVTYDVPALKGLSFALQYETQETDTDGVSKYDTDELRFLANYKF